MSMRRTTSRSRARTILGRMNSFSSSRSATHRMSSASSGSFPDLNIQRTNSKNFMKKKKVLPALSGSTRYRGIFEKWQFSAVKLSRSELKEAAVEMLEKSFRKLHSRMRRSKLNDLMATALPAITEFVDTVEQHYNESAFHSFIHAVDVAQLMYTLLEEYFEKKIKKEEYFYLIVAALCHDINHPGATAKTLKKLGLLEDDMTLEDYHVQKTVELFESGELELINNEALLNKEQRENLIRYCRLLIEATDIAKHNNYVEAVSDDVENGSKLELSHLAILMKVSDLANISREFNDSCAWSQNFKVEMAAEHEFNNSEDAEMFKMLDLPRDEMFVRLSRNLIVRQERIRRELSEQNALMTGTSKTTLIFMDLFAFPLVKCLEKMNPVGGNIYGTRIRKNQEDWAYNKY